jgi:hypothetical protein
MSVPGRYSHNRYPELAALLHQVTLDGWANDSTGDTDQDGFHASLIIVEPAEQQDLTDAFDHPIPAGNWILLEDDQGFVTVEQYPTARTARQGFNQLQDHSGGPAEDDGTITPAGPPAAASPTSTAPPSSRVHATATGPAGAAAVATPGAYGGDTPQPPGRGVANHPLPSLTEGRSDDWP